MRRAAMTMVCILCGCTGDKDPTLPTSSTASTGEPTTGEATSSPTGGEETGFEPTAGGGPFEPKIAYVAGGAGSEGRVAWMNLDGSEAMPLTGGGGGMEYPVRWSRSGANVLFNRGSDIWRVTPETGEEFNVTDTPDQFNSYLDMSPDGAWVLFSGTRDNVAGLYRVRITGGEAKPLVTAEDQFSRFDARYSPDGQKIAYILATMGGGNRLFVSDDLGEGALEISGIVAEAAPTWSPDGAMLAVGGYLGDDTSGIFRFTPAGAGMQQITTSRNALFARWSPDGARIAFYGNTEDHSGWLIGVVDPDGANETHLTEEYETCYLPDWSPDSASLVFGCSDEQKGQGIFTMVVDGGTPTMILSEPNLSWYPQWRP